MVARKIKILIASEQYPVQGYNDKRGQNSRFTNTLILLHFEEIQKTDPTD